MPPRSQKYGAASVCFCEFCSSDTFLLHGIDSSFLQQDPQTWEGIEEYQFAVRRAASLKVVNGYAERGVALMTDFNPILTKNEDQNSSFCKLSRHIGNI